MVRRAERAFRFEIRIELTGDRMDRRDLKHFLKRRRRQNAAQCFGEHGLAGTGWAAHRGVVPARCGDRKPALRALLSFYLSHIYLRLFIGELFR
jgi:hypothetical protein